MNLPDGVLLRSRHFKHRAGHAGLDHHRVRLLAVEGPIHHSALVAVEVPLTRFRHPFAQVLYDIVLRAERSDRVDAARFEPQRPGFRVVFHRPHLRRVPGMVDRELGVLEREGRAELSLAVDQDPTSFLVPVQTALLYPPELMGRGLVLHESFCGQPRIPSGLAVHEDLTEIRGTVFRLRHGRAPERPVLLRLPARDTPAAIEHRDAVLRPLDAQVRIFGLQDQRLVKCVGALAEDNASPRRKRFRPFPGFAQLFQRRGGGAHRSVRTVGLRRRPPARPGIVPRRRYEDRNCIRCHVRLPYHSVFSSVLVSLRTSLTAARTDH